MWEMLLKHLPTFGWTLEIGTLPAGMFIGSKEPVKKIFGGNIEVGKTKGAHFRAKATLPK